MINKLKILITAAVCILLINSCFDKNESLTILDTSPANDIAYVKFINAYAATSPSTTTLPTPPGPAVNVFVNNAKINAGAIAYGGSFPLSPSYTGIAPGLAINIKIILSRATGVVMAGDTLSNKNYDLGPNSYTTLYLADTTPSPTPFNPFVLPFQELVSNAPVGYFRARFINMIPSNDTLEVFSKRLNAVIFNGQLYKNASPVVELPTFLIGDTLQLRKVSAPATILATQPLATPFFPTSSRTYTIYSSGSITGTPRARALTVFTNR
jgi:hypothetical protein